ncbi:calcineurin-like phosphoesterase family protein [Sediminihabitans luteus]|uniref:Calcineurin-like phosphoesterase family protein n=1 Tax=Sediminihabitans luteus TaxID=1138585 RepID=A0A2M9D194_9CELL|nr:metallophosphoesterase family protein [Sediminihabitans luteus]PJJ77949.1 calcineurin-like phosphoesterase family protein [Sediminihabitans luteus]GII99693.1 hypothetical protein Slu03_20710 [Sediminihabitans luteus]
MNHGATPLRRRLVRPTAATLGLVLVAGAVTFAATTASAADLPASYLGAGTTWHYSDDDTDPAAGAADRLGWTEGDFDDTTWKTAAGPFGAKRGLPTGLGTGFPVGTLLTQYLPGTTTDVRTFHFRSAFDVPADNLAEISALTGTVTYDDAVQVFVNGTKVAGFVDDLVEAAPEAQRNLMYAGDANGDPLTSTFTVPADALVAGENTIAIALYQDRATSSDVYLDVKDLAPVHVDTPVTVSDVVLGIGADESQRNVSWYTGTDVPQVAQVARTADLVDGKFPAAAVTVDATGGPTTSGEFDRKATFTGLQENTAYSYRVGTPGSWSPTSTFRTQDFDGDLEFLFFGDPQIGASGNTAADGAGWADTLDVAQATYPDAEMLFSAGDQVNSAGSESQYDAFLAPSQLREIPFVPTNGNHDVGSKAYEQHFNVPNDDPTAGAGTATSSGGDYWFIYKDVLFVNINSNSRDDAAHNAFMEKVVAEHGDEARWKVLAFHHSIYSVAAHTDDSDIKARRASMPATISDLGFDVVLMGHDHSYTRSYLIKDGEVADAAEVPGQADVTADEGEVLYVTANSASGSKYYAVKAPDAPFASVINQENVRNYSAVEITDDAISITTLRSEAKDGERPVNSVVDEITLHRADDATPVADDEQRLQVTVPEGSTDPGELVWNVDGSNDLVDLGTATAQGDHWAATGSINPIRVTDTRTAGPVWSVSAQVSDFASDGGTFSGRYLGWAPTLVQAGGGASAGATVASGFGGGGPGLSTSSTLGSAGVGHALGTALLGADLDLRIPVDVTDGTYQATLTLTALS